MACLRRRDDGPGEAEPEGSMIDVPGGRLHVVIDGTGPPVILCSGLGGRSFDWDDVASRLADRRVIRFDRPGVGGSPDDGEFPTVAGEARRIASVLTALRIDKADVVGHSMGGFYAEGFARLYPDRCGHLVLLDSSVPDQRPVLPRRWRLAVARAVASVARTKTGTFLAAVVREYVAYPELCNEIRQLRRDAPLPVATHVAMADTGRFSLLGRRWLRLQQDLSRELNAEFTVISPSGHRVMIDQPDAVAALFTA
ncbi:MAG: alpha/beta hydrolase [Nocardiaceae bacterium]|nr:alpha/beta hydrolase [Nocardiaceae bacterium]